MTIDYLANCKTPEDAKATYRHLCKTLHPDTPGGDAAKMKELNSQYKKWITARNATYTYSIFDSTDGRIHISVAPGVSELQRELNDARFATLRAEDRVGELATENRRLAAEIAKACTIMQGLQNYIEQLESTWWQRLKRWLNGD